MSLDPVISPGEVAALPELVLLDCRPDPGAYAAGHVSGAVHAQLERDLASGAPEPKHGGRHPLPELGALCAALGRWGVTPRSHVVAYDDQGGANAAARAWWLLRALSHPRVHVVDGGLQAMLRAGHALTREQPKVQPAPPYPAHSFQGLTAEIDEVDAARTDPGRAVIDVRAAFRYLGESEPIDPIAGHIPGARNLPFSDNLRADGRFKSADELRPLYEQLLRGVAPAQAIVHCGSGVTACHTLLALERAGLSGARLYVGSWSEWCRNPERERAP